MNWFADTFYFLAILNPADLAHTRALSLTQNRQGDLITTDWVLTEVADAMAGVQSRRSFLVLLNTLTHDPTVHLVEATRKLFDEGIDLFARRADKDWSLTDCISFVVMKQRRVRGALTADHHFEQAGFVALLK